MAVLSALILENIPALICLVLGFCLVVVEMYLPGFGVPGISGLVLLGAGIWLKARNAVEALILTAVIVALLLVALAICLHSISKGRLSKSKMVLSAVSASPDEPNALAKYVGMTGTSRTLLRPAGIGEIGGERLNVVSDGEFIPEGAAITVVSAEGNRIVVKKTEE